MSINIEKNNREKNNDNYESEDFAFENESDTQSFSLSDFGKFIENQARTFFEKHARKLSFDEYIDEMSSRIDKNILDTIAEDKNKKHYGGYIYFTISEDKKYLNFKITNYYKADEQWYNSENTGKTKITIFDPDTSKATLKEIYAAQQSGKEYKIEISTPEILDQINR